MKLGRPGGRSRPNPNYDYPNLGGWKGGRSHPVPKLGYPKKGFLNPVKMISNWGGRELGPGL